jgi:ubiquitin carboxyl-terminal hydrolase 8
MIVIYDRASIALPNVQPHSTSSDAQRILWTLTSAIYEREFTKSLKRQPVLLKGGWEAWEKYVGAKGIERDGEASTDNGRRRRESVDEFGRIEAKKANRKAAIVPAGSGGAVMRNGGGIVSLAVPLER